MEHQPDDLDTARAAIAGRGLTAEASAHLTGTVAMNLPFEALGPFKNALKHFFSAQPWSELDAEGLSAVVAEHLADDAWWDHEVAPGLRIIHGRRGDNYVLWATGDEGSAAPSIFDRVFDGPVIPEATPHPRKVKFNTGGTAAPGRWYRRGDDIDDDRVGDLLTDGDVTDVMVAGDFVTVGLDRHSDWEQRLDPLLERVTILFWAEDAGADESAPARTRDELVSEGLAIGRAPDAAELHLLDPDDPRQRDRLEHAAAGDDARLRRVAVVTLAQSQNQAYVNEVLRAGYADEARIVRRAAIDAAGDLTLESLRDLFEQALSDDDAWSRWKAIRALRDLGVGASLNKITALAEDEDFQVRMEVAAALRG